MERKAVEMALAGDPTAMRLCMERVLPPCHERTVKFSLPLIESALAGQTRGPSARDVSLAMNSVTAALAQGEITPGEAEKIAGVVDTFVRAIETSDFERRFKIIETELPANLPDAPDPITAGLGW